jgi:hypothetical protein
MKKILASLAIIAVVSATSVGATKAYFTSDVTQTGVTFATGTLIMTDASASWQLPVTFTNLKPGDTIRKWVVLHNAGTLDIGHLTVQATNKSDSGGLLDQVLVSVIGYDNDGAHNIYFTPGWGTGGSAINPWMTTAEDILSSSAAIYNQGITSFTIPSGQDDVIVLDFTVPSTLDNSYQNVSASFNLVFHAEQVHP